MRNFVSIPVSLINYFDNLAEKEESSWFCTSDPKEAKLGSGGGTAWLLSEAWKAQESGISFDDWLTEENKVLIHGGGQSRRLPAYASLGKLMLPIPVFRWEHG